MTLMTQLSKEQIVKILSASGRVNPAMVEIRRTQIGRSLVDGAPSTMAIAKQVITQYDGTCQSV